MQAQRASSTGLKAPITACRGPAGASARRSTAPSDRLELFVFGAEDGSQARAVAVLDNLGKGASGAAVQSLNLMAGLAETAGLALAD